LSVNGVTIATADPRKMVSFSLLIFSPFSGACRYNNIKK